MNPDLTKQEKQKKMLPVLVILVLTVLLPFVLGEYQLMLCCTIFYYIIAVSGLDILFGYSGQISLGHAAFYAIGAYGSALMHNYWHLPVFVTMILASIIATGIGALLAVPASKLVFHFLSLSTIAFGEIVYQLLVHSPGMITGDFKGIYSTQMTFFGQEFSYRNYFFFALICAVVFLLAKFFLVNSKTGRAFTAIRENSHAANGMGINVRRYKVMAFATSAFYTAFAGAMYMHLVGFVHPDTFVKKQSVLFLTMLLFGGTGTMFGPIIGVISVELLIESLRSLQEMQGFVYGVLLLIVIVALPGGLYGGLRDIYAFVMRKLGKGPAPESEVKKGA
ncbi:MAG: branched-chain amino acid ABC transporter permease [Clostridiales bacterium]|nr:branched-chain amino acid ABC transporter permease [Clostridiales bacterium]